MSSDELERCAVEIDIFARVSPVHKLKLVEALQNRNEVVGMTGDGANDAPALKRASVGIAMGIKGTEVSKESSEMVLTDDNFTSITNAIIEGRAVYDNLAKTLLFLLPTNGAQALVIVLALFTGTALPLTPVQVLWVNLVTAVTLALALVLEPPEKDIMLRRPRAPDRPLVTPFLLWRITFVSFFFSLGTFLMFLYYFSTGSTYAVSQTVAINTLVIFQIFYLFNTRFVIAPVRSLRDFTENKYILLAISLAVIFQIVLTYLPFFQNLFGTAALGVEKWLVMIMLGVMVFISIELEKSATRVYTNKKEKLNSS
jgi:magnesium-transporting ATPase (P-type)